MVAKVWTVEVDDAEADSTVLQCAVVAASRSQARACFVAAGLRSARGAPVVRPEVRLPQEEAGVVYVRDLASSQWQRHR